MSCILPTKKKASHCTAQKTDVIPLQMADPHSANYHRGACVQVTVHIYMYVQEGNNTDESI